VESSRRTSTLEVFALSSNDFRNGTNIVLDGVPWRVQEFLHVKPGKGAAFVRTKLRNYITGNTVDRTFRAGESVDEASISKEVKQYTYMDADQYVFMDMVSFEEIRIGANELGDKTKWLKEGMECNVLTWNDKVLDVDLPITVVVKVVQTDPGLKGDTAQGGSKPATTETGAVVSVPLFVNEGDMIQVDTRKSEYMSRVGAF
jgi:elongation factor P